MYEYYMNADHAHKQHPDGFTYNLPDGLYKEEGLELGLSELHIRFKDPTVLCFNICCNIIGPSYVNGDTIPILRRVHMTTGRHSSHLIFNPVVFKPIVQPWISGIRVYLRDVKSPSSSFELETLECTLQIQQQS